MFLPKLSINKINKYLHNKLKSLMFLALVFNRFKFECKIMNFDVIDILINVMSEGKSSKSFSHMLYLVVRFLLFALCLLLRIFGARKHVDNEIIHKIIQVV